MGIVTGRLLLREFGACGRLLFAAVLLVALALFAACSGGGSALDSATTPEVLLPPTSAPTRPPETPSGTPIARPFDLPILMYHDVSPTPPDDIYRAASNVLPAEFATQLDYLKCAGYNTVTMSQLFEAIHGDAGLPPRPIILSFDDGYENHYSQVFPLLKARGFAGSFAIITGFVGDNGVYMTWGDIEQMADGGMEFMSHTVSHIDLNTSDDATVREQVRASKASLEEHTGQPVRFLVYPSGEPFRSGSQQRQREVVSMLREAGYEGALLAGPSSISQDPETPFALNRVRVSAGEDIATYAASIGGPAPESCG